MAKLIILNEQKTRKRAKSYKKHGSNCIKVIQLKRIIYLWFTDYCEWLNINSLMFFVLHWYFHSMYKWIFTVPLYFPLFFFFVDNFMIINIFRLYVDGNNEEAKISMFSGILKFYINLVHIHWDGNDELPWNITKLHPSITLLLILWGNMKIMLFYYAQVIPQQEES